MEILLFLLALAYAIGLPISVIILFSQHTNLTHRLKAIENRLEFLTDRVALLWRGEEGPAPAEPAPPIEEPAPPRPEPVPEPEAEVPISKAPAPALAHSPADEKSMAAILAEWERRFAERWMVWLGGVALALGGAFLVKFSIDQGLIGPRVRIVLGLIAAFAMVGTGEWLRRRKDEEQDHGRPPDYVPPVLAAAGLFTGFATLFAAHSLYGFIPALLTFILLALVSVGGLALALWHGRALAILGLLGAYAVPILVSVGEPNALTLFGYLFVVTAITFEVLRYRDWPIVALWALLLTGLWIGLWMVGFVESADSAAIAIFGLALAALLLFRFFPDRAKEGKVPPPNARWYEITFYGVWRQLLLAGIALAAFAILVATVLEHHSAPILITAALFILLCGIAAVRNPDLDLLLPGAGIFTILFVSLWHLPDLALAVNPDAQRFQGVSLTPQPFIPAEYLTFAVACLSYGVLFLAGGFAALRRALRPGFWAACTVSTALALLAFAYWRIHQFSPNFGWGVVGLATSGVLLFFTERVMHIGGGKAAQGAIAAYAVGVTGALALAFAMTLENAWLTVALAAEVAALAWVWDRFRLPSLIRTAFVLAVVVIVRLTLNPYLPSYGAAGMLPGLNWILYGYGIPLAAFALARQLFGPSGELRLRDALEAGMLIFALLLVTLEIRSLMSESGSIAGAYRFAERAVQTVNFAAFSLFTIVLESRQRRDLFRMARWAMTVALVANILFNGGPFELFGRDVAVGTLPVFNLLLLAYLIPGATALFGAWIALKSGLRNVARLYGIGGLMLLLVWLTLEVRHAFHGTHLGVGSMSNAESYTYSAAWLIFAAVLLAAALWRRLEAVRHASLAVLLLTVFKVFLFDLDALEGLWRAMSFLGLGAVLVAIGYLYRNHVYAHKDADAPG